MHAVLAHVAKKEKFDLPSTAAEQIVEDANGNMRKAILVLEALKMQSYVSSFLPSVVVGVRHDVEALCLPRAWGLALTATTCTFPHP